MSKALAGATPAGLSQLESLLADLGTLSKGDVLRLAAIIDPYVWTVRHRRLRGQPMRFNVVRQLRQYADESKVPRQLLLRHRPFLIQPLRDQHPHKVYKKSRQVGVSELSVTETIRFLALNPQAKCVYCVPDDAEILTDRGWLHYHEVQATDRALVLDPASHVSRWEPIKAVRVFDFDGELLPVGMFHCTSEHRWPVLKRYQRRATREPEVVTTDQLTQRHTLVRMAPHASDVVEGPLSPRLAAILGWVVTDGHLYWTGTAPNLNTPMMHITQSRKKHLAKIERLCRMKRKASRYSEAPTIYTGSRGGRVVGYTQSGNPIYGDTYTVRVRREDANAIVAAGYLSKDDLPGLVTRLSLKAARAMWRAMLNAEGCLSGKRRRSLFFAQDPGPVLDAFQILCALLGMAANLTQRGAYVVDPTSRSARSRAVYPQSPTRRYAGKVWCPMTPSGTWFMRYRGRVVFTGNTFPRDTQLRDFSITRISEAFAESPAMQRLLGVPNQIYTKRIGDGYMILRSAWESNLGEGVDADMIVLDEKDRMKPGIDVAFKESLQSSRWGFMREVSTPTLPGRGIDEPWLRSCQYMWFVKCTKCGMRQPIQYPENVVQMKDVPTGAKQLDPGTYEYRCRRDNCRGPLDRWQGEWIATKPSQSHIAGYLISQLMCPWITATDLMQKKIDYRYEQLWDNYCRGETSAGDRILVSEDDFTACVAGHPWQTHRALCWSRVAVGIDWGHLNWVIVVGVHAENNLPYVIGLGVFEDDYRNALKSAIEVEKFIEPFGPDIIIADAGYGKDRNAYLYKKYEGIFFANYYNPSDKHSRTFQPQFTPNSGRMISDRTIALKDATSWIRAREVGLPAFDRRVKLLQDHCLALATLRLEDDGDIYEVIENTGDDHLAHCLGYARMGVEYLTKGWRNFSMVIGAE